MVVARLLGCALLILSFSGAALAAPYLQDSGSNGLVSMEAENADQNLAGNTHVWSAVNPPGVGGGVAMESTPNTGGNNNAGYIGVSPELRFEVEFVNSGIHYVWLHGIGGTGTDDSVHVGLNGAVSLTSDRMTPLSAGPSVQWFNNTMDAAVARINVPNPGVHMVNLWMREDGFVLDKVVLTTNAAYDPLSEGPLGPPESPRGSGSAVATPVINPAGGSFSGPVNATVSTTTPGASLFYTVDGSTPSSASTPYTGPITVSQSLTLRAIGVLGGSSDSAVASSTFTIGLGSGAYLQDSGSNGLVSMEAENADQNLAGNTHVWSAVNPPGVGGGVAMESTPNTGGNNNAGYIGVSPELRFEVEFVNSGIHYVWLHGIGGTGADDSVHVGLNGAVSLTSDRMTPLSAGPSVQWFNNTMDAAVARINVPNPGVHMVNLWMREDGFVLDKVVLTTNAAYDPLSEGPLGPPESPRGSTVAQPVINPAGGSFSGPVNATVSTTTPGASLFYTVDGSTPSSASTPYTGPITVSQSLTLRAIGVLGGSNDSTVATASFTINAGAVATPVINPAGGSFTDPVDVTLSTTTSGASLFYTVDGSTPSSASTPYTGPITVSQGLTLRAIGVLGGSSDSAVASATFTIGLGDGAYLQDSGSNGLVSMEAENADQNLAGNTHVWSAVNPPGVGGGVAMESTPNTGDKYNTGYIGASPELRFPVEFVNSGIHYVWVHGIGGADGDDSVHVGLNGGVSLTSDRMTPLSASTSVQWFNNTMDAAVARINVPNPGMHMVNLWMREDGFVLDKVVLTTNAAYDPLSEGPLGPPESPRGSTVAQPVINPAGGSFSGPVNATVSTTTPGASLFYTVDGSTPSSASTPYTGPITVSQSLTLRAIGVLGGSNDSTVATASFTINAGTVATPVINPAGGSFTDPVDVTLSTTTSGASLFYTVDGSTPSSASTPYTGPINISQGLTLRAIGVLGGSSDSAVASATFTIGLGDGAYLQDSGSNGLVSMEAENADQNLAGNTHVWSAVNPPGVGGGVAMESTPNTGVVNNTGYIGVSPELRFPVEFVNSGIHYVWVHGIGGTAGDDSVHVGLNGAVSLTSDRMTPLSAGPSVQWFNNTMDAAVARINVPNPGMHMVNLWMREDGFVLDKVVLTTNAAYDPLSEGPLGPPESPRGEDTNLPVVDDFNDGNAAGWTTVDETLLPSNWQVDNGVYRQTKGVGFFEQAGAFEGNYHVGTFSVFDASTNLSNYRFSADVTTLALLGDACGLMWRYQSPDLYYRISFNFRDGFTLLQKKVLGVWTTLSKNGRGPQIGQTQNVVVEVNGSLMQVSVDGQKLFAARDASLSSGGVAVYGRDVCGFDNISLTGNSNLATVGLASPTDFSSTSSLQTSVSAVVMNKPPGTAVEFELNGVPCGASTESQPGLFESSCSAPQKGVYSLTAELLDQSVVVDSDSYGSVALGGINYLSAGDSITNGAGDNFSLDSSSSSGRRVSIRGLQANLEEALLQTDPLTPPIVFNVAVPGHQSVNVLAQVPGLLEEHPDADTLLLMVGTNDALNTFDSGLGCVNNCAGTYFQRLQDIVDAFVAAGKTVRVGQIPPIFGVQNGQQFFANPASEAINSLVLEYNSVVTQQLVNILPGPDTYAFFLGDANRVFLFDDVLHPNSLGHMMIANLWHNSLTGLTALPFIVDSIELRLNQGASPVAPLPYRQNLLEVGNRYFVDSTATLSTIPSGFDQARWIVLANSDRNRTNTDYLMFDIGGDTADVYVAYPANASVLPAWLASGWANTGMSITTSDSAAPTLNLYLKSAQTGIVQLGGAGAASSGAGSNYLVLVLEN